MIASLIQRFSRRIALWIAMGCSTLVAGPLSTLRSK